LMSLNLCLYGQELCFLKEECNFICQVKCYE
jgi:hypothetical protein